MSRIKDSNGRLVEIQEDGETVWSRKHELKQTRAEAIADLVKADVVSETKIDEIPDQEVCDLVHEKCDHNDGGDS